MLISNFASRLGEAISIRNIKASEIVRLSEKLYEEGKINKPLTKPLISHYLKGSYEAKQDNVHTLSIILDVDETWLMGYDVPMKQDTISSEKNDKQIKEEFNFAYHKEAEGLTDEEIADAIRFYKQIKYGKKEKNNEQ